MQLRSENVREFVKPEKHDTRKTIVRIWTVEIFKPKMTSDEFPRIIWLIAWRSSLKVHCWNLLQLYMRHKSCEHSGSNDENSANELFNAT